MAVRVGSPVPDVEFEYYKRGEGAARRMSLSSLRGQWVVLFFYPRDFTFICPTEIAEFARLHADFLDHDAVLIGASTDSYHSHKAWYETDERLASVEYPVAADTAHKLAQEFDVLIESGATHRGTFIIDPDGVLRHMSVNEHDVGRNVDETLRILQGLQTGELCPVAWRPGLPTLTSYDEYLARAFPRLTPKLLAETTETARSVHYAAGETIIEQGTPANRMYVVREGEVEIIRHRGRPDERTLATLKPGEHFGEIGLLTESARTASVRARTDTDLLELSLEDFRGLTESSEPARKDLSEIVEWRLAAIRRGEKTETGPAA